MPSTLGFHALIQPLLRARPSLPEELQLHPQYRVQRGLEAILRKVPAGSDQFITEKYQDLVAAVLDEWNLQLLQSPVDAAVLGRFMPTDFSGSSLDSGVLHSVGEHAPLEVWRVEFPKQLNQSKELFLSGLQDYLAGFSKLITVEFQVVRIHAEPSSSMASADSTQVTVSVRYELVGTGNGFHREHRVGHWEQRWKIEPSGELHLQTWECLDETRSRSPVPVFHDITAQAFGRNPCYSSQLLPGTDYWRTVLDGACGIDIYGHNGVSVADIDGDGLDDLYICQPAGLPNRLFHNRGDGTFEDITDSAGVGVMENSACALFADINNSGRQDLIVVRASGPLLFLNQGGGTFRLKPDAFQFANPPQGTFTGAATADYDRDGWLDIYFCLYSYYQGADQYRYPMPYTDAENGPPNFLMRNNRDGTFRDVTKQTGLDKNNTRFSFACAWSDYNGDLWPDLYVVNDFGRKNLYRNNGDGTFTDVAPEAGVENVGAGMSGAWFDFDGDGRDDLYVANMWTAGGIRVSTQDIFQKEASAGTRSYYQMHAMGNVLFRNAGAKFADVGKRSGTTMGRWSWCSDSWDFDHDGYPDLYIANGMITGAGGQDLNSFFWRQVVANSPNEPRPSHEYEQGWNAINELIRSDGTWSGFERNIFYLNNRDGTFFDVSGVVGLDCVEDSRSFALGDFDQDGRLEVVLKNRNSPQLRYWKNVLPELLPAISFRLMGRKSNRDAIGARITVETGSGRQSRMIQAGSGFLAQHTKELFFGLGAEKSSVQATIQWPSGIVQRLHDLPLNHRIWVEEGSPPTRMEPFKPFAVPPANAGGPAPAKAEVLPHKVETWLLVPIPAPNFSLPDTSGHPETLSSHRGKPVLLYFWSAVVADSQKDLDEFEHFHTAWSRQGLQLLTVEVEIAAPGAAGSPQKLDRHFSFPILKSTPDVIATYSLLYRQLFDRHRDMSVPISFLIDSAGQIVKIYQGSVRKDHIEADFKSIPQTEVQRLGKALPFAGLTESYDYGRNNLSFGFIFFEGGYFEQAEEFFSRASKDDPQSAEALYGLGSAYLQQQKNQQARDCFQRTLQVHSSYPGTIPNAWNNLGILAAREGHTDLAIQYLQNALQIDPEHSIALTNLGTAYRQKRDWYQAQRALKHALALNPDDPEANYSLGMVFAQQNDTERAYEYLQKALAVRPAYPEALNNLGILYLRTRRTEQAMQSFKESIRVAPSYDQAYLNLARVYAIQGDRDKAKAVLRDLLKQHPDHAQAKEMLQQFEH